MGLGEGAFFIQGCELPLTAGVVKLGGPGGLLAGGWMVGYLFFIHAGVLGPSVLAGTGFVFG